MADDPFALFSAWFGEAQASETNDPEAMALATSTPGGRPSVRVVLLKDHGPTGFTWYTNGESRKGEELAANPHAAICLHWKSLRRQVRVEGPVAEVSAAEADAYFASRSRDSQVGAWASDQSRPLNARATFERRVEEAKSRFGDEGAVPRPAHWTGFRLAPHTIEFWEDRPFRLHHRRLFTRSGGDWSESLLYP